jgi:hypothetical protein
VSKGFIFTRSSAVPIAHIAPAVVAVFVEAIDVGKLTLADVLAIVGVAEFAEFERLMGSPVPAGNPKSKI